MSLLLDIARCRQAEAILSGNSAGADCAEIVRCQPVPPSEWQAPEPWSGDLERAPLLFLGSNPGLGRSENYPLWHWPDEDIEDFFTHRFGGGKREWVKDGLHPLLLGDSGATYKTEYVRYWAAIGRRAAEILQRPSVRPGIDYAISEVVHCKSSHEVGVRRAFTECVETYLEPLVSTSGARVIVAMGRHSATAISRVWHVPSDTRLCGPVVVGGRERFFVFLPHPSSFGPKTLGGILSGEQAALLRDLLSR